MRFRGGRQQVAVTQFWAISPILDVARSKSDQTSILWTFIFHLRPAVEREVFYSYRILLRKILVRFSRLFLTELSAWRAIVYFLGSWKCTDILHPAERKLYNYFTKFWPCHKRSGILSFHLYTNCGSKLTLFLKVCEILSK